jgi:hypothetical protein
VCVAPPQRTPCPEVCCQRSLLRVRPCAGLWCVQVIASSSAAATRAAGDGVLMEGPLRKKNSKGIGRVFSGFRTRYFVLDVHDAVLYYFESA